MVYVLKFKILVKWVARWKTPHNIFFLNVGNWKGLFIEVSVLQVNVMNFANVMECKTLCKAHVNFKFWGVMLTLQIPNRSKSYGCYLCRNPIIYRPTLIRFFHIHNLLSFNKISPSKSLQAYSKKNTCILSNKVLSFIFKSVAGIIKVHIKINLVNILY